jgi:imidazole glycerol phosphate synthase subunit HisF
VDISVIGRDGTPLLRRRADEIVFYDITARVKIAYLFGCVKRVASNIFYSLFCGGGIASVEDMRRSFLAGAEKVSVNSRCGTQSPIISEGERRLLSAIVVGMDCLGSGKRTLPFWIRDCH